MSKNTADGSANTNNFAYEATTQEDSLNFEQFPSMKNSLNTRSWRITSRPLKESIKFSKDIKDIQKEDAMSRKSYMDHEMNISEELLPLKIRKIEATERIAKAEEL